MADTNFVDDQTVIYAAWANEVNRATYRSTIDVTLSPYSASPDNSASANTAAFNAAISTKKAVYVPGDSSVIYNLNPLAPATGNIYLYGHGANLKFTGTSDCITLQQASSQQRLIGRISGFKFSGTSTPSSFIKNAGFLNLQLDHLQFSDCAATYCINNQIGYGLSVNKCVFSDVTGSAILLQQTAGLTNYSNISTITDCDITRMSADGITAQGIYSLRASSVVMESCAGTGLKLSSSTQPSKEVTLTNCWFESNGTSVSCGTDGSTYAVYATLVGCVFDNGAVINLGSLGNLTLVGCGVEPSGTATITGSANARTNLINSPGFFQSGSFNFFDQNSIQGKFDFNNPGGVVLPISVNAGTAGRTFIIALSRQTAAGNNTCSSLYMVRCGYDGSNFSYKQIAFDDGPLGGGASTFTFGQSGGFLTVVPAGAGNCSMTWFSSGSFFSA